MNEIARELVKKTLENIYRFAEMSAKLTKLIEVYEVDEKILKAMIYLADDIEHDMDKLGISDSFVLKRILAERDDCEMFLEGMADVTPGAGEHK